MKKYEAQANVYDKASKHTAVSGEDCTLEQIEVFKTKTIAVIKNSVGNTLRIPLAVFERWFK